VIRQLLDTEHMPNLASLISRGESSNIATLYRVLSPTLWTSMATGNLSGGSLRRASTVLRTSKMLLSS